LKIAELKEKEPVDGVYLATRKEMAVAKSGKPYLIARLMDSSGEAEARAWDGAEEMAGNFDKDDVVRVRGHAVAYQGDLQINISSARRVNEGDYDLRDLLPSSERDPDEMIAELDGIISAMEDEDLKTLLETLFRDGGEVRSLYKIAPAAKGMHHSYIGGLLEHVLSACRVAAFLRGHYSGVDGDMLLAGVILHDIGKIYELSYKRGFDYTDRGKLIGHITIGVEMIDEAIRGQKDFPETKAVLLKHMILSHHGVLEYGSPKRPKTLEAVILSFIDDLDAKVEAVKSFIGKDRGETNWTGYHRLLERYIFKGFPRDPTAPAPRADAEEGPAAAEEKRKKEELDLF